MPIYKMPETSMHTTALLNTLWEFTRGVEDDKDSFIQNALKVFKTFEIKFLRHPSLMFQQRRQHTICFAKIWERQKKS